jgi:NTP pyrophosphatase (non-canonical NTP hydrolase)
MNPFNGLTPAEHERLAILAEELGEAAQAIGKILRHGYESYHPSHPERGSNRHQLELELGDVSFAISLLTRTGDVSFERINERAFEKAESIKSYLHHQDEGDR